MTRNLTTNPVHARLSSNEGHACRAKPVCRAFSMHSVTKAYQDGSKHWSAHIEIRTQTSKLLLYTQLRQSAVGKLFNASGTKTGRESLSPTPAPRPLPTPRLSPGHGSARRRRVAQSAVWRP